MNRIGYENWDTGPQPAVPTRTERRGYWQRFVGKLKGSDQPPSGPSRISGNDQAPERTEDGDWVVGPDTTWSQILDQAAGRGYLYGGQKLVINRDVAMTYACMARCATLISAVCAQLITGGHLRVVDAQRKRQSSRRIDKALETLAYSPDRGVTSSFAFWEDCYMDYTFEGNAIIVPGLSSDGIVTSFRRMAVWDGEISYTREGRPVYRVAPVDGNFRTETIAGRDLIHPRFPRMQGAEYSKRTSRQGFAVPPIVSLTPALGIGIRGDSYVLEWFKHGSKSKSHFNIKLEPGEDPLTPNEQKKLTDWVLAQTRSGNPVITQAMESSRIDDTPQDRNAGDLREQQILEVARFYGVPAPLIGVQMTSWGKGIEDLAKLFVRYCVTHHLERFLSPMSLRLLPRGMKFMADMTELLRGDAEAISKLLSVGMGGPNSPRILTFEESRHAWGLSADPEGSFEYPSDDMQQNNDGNDSGGGDGQGEGDGSGPAQPPAAPTAPPPIGGADDEGYNIEPGDLRCSQCDKLLAKDSIFVLAKVKCPRCDHVEVQRGKRRSR